MTIPYDPPVTHPKPEVMMVDPNLIHDIRKAVAELNWLANQPSYCWIKIPDKDARRHKLVRSTDDLSGVGVEFFVIGTDTLRRRPEPIYDARDLELDFVDILDDIHAPARHEAFAALFPDRESIR